MGSRSALSQFVPSIATARKRSSLHTPVQVESLRLPFAPDAASVSSSGRNIRDPRIRGHRPGSAQCSDAPDVARIAPVAAANIGSKSLRLIVYLRGTRLLRASRIVARASGPGSACRDSPLFLLRPLRLHPLRLVVCDHLVYRHPPHGLSHHIQRQILQLLEPHAPLPHVQLLPRLCKLRLEPRFQLRVLIQRAQVQLHVPLLRR